MRDEHALLQAENLSLETLWTNLSFTLLPGCLLQITGANGAGKSSLLKTLCGLIAPDGGTVFWRKQNIDDAADSYRADLLYVGHKNGIKDALTPLENLQYAASLQDNPPLLSPQEALTTTRLSAHAFEELCARLSAGQKRRVALARLLLHRAGLWFLDEPAAGLDDAGRELLGQMVREHLSSGGAVVAAVHQPPEWTSDVQTLHLGHEAETNPNGTPLSNSKMDAGDVGDTGGNAI